MKKSPYPYLVALAFVAPVYVWLVVGCPGLTIDNSYHNHIQIERVLVKDTAEVKRLTKDNYWLRQELYKKPKVRRDTVYVGHKGAIIGMCKKCTLQNNPYTFLNFPPDTRQVAKLLPDNPTRETRNAFPITAEYNARTDKWPVGTGKNYTEIRNKHNKEWEDLPHRASEDSLFKAK